MNRTIKLVLGGVVAPAATLAVLLGATSHSAPAHSAPAHPGGLHPPHPRRVTPTPRAPRHIRRGALFLPA